MLIEIILILIASVIATPFPVFKRNRVNSPEPVYPRLAAKPAIAQHRETSHCTAALPLLPSTPAWSSRSARSAPLLPIPPLLLPPPHSSHFQRVPTRLPQVSRRVKGNVQHCP